MSYTVNLTESELADMAAVLEAVWELKRSGPRGVRLSADKLTKFEEDWLHSALVQLKNNHFTVNSATSNTFKWLIDQIEYTGLAAHPELYVVQSVLEVCAAAGGGESVWRTYRRRGGHTQREVFKRLFEQS